MTTDRICAFYSSGPHYVRMLRCLRENCPDATLVAAIPASFPFDAIDDLVDETVRLPDRKASRDLRGGYFALRSIRQAQCTQIVVMFDSPRLNLLSALSGTRDRHCFTVDGRFYRLNKKTAVLVASTTLRRLRGQWNFLCAWWGTRKS
ncbi:MAG: hypothetical protein L3K26_16395 [Candidatus Hydrogenedentes bacterium]|nr:hypothetical protein [Candidatus Hydrogenedentota bacterium]